MTIPGKETQGNKIRKLELLYLSDNGSKNFDKITQEMHKRSTNIWWQ